MFRELFYILLWASMWAGLYHNLHTHYTKFKSYSSAVQNNIFSAVHSVTSILFARYILYDTHMSANDFLYKYSTTTKSLLDDTVIELGNLTLTNESTYGNMLEIYNHVIDTHSVTLISLKMMSICYFLYDIGYIVIHNLMFKKCFYLYHHILMILLHYYAYTSENTYEYIWLFYYGELSNLFTYTTYHYMKTGNQRMAYISSLIQFVWFWYYRGLVFGSILIPFTMSLDSYLMRVLLIPIYVMGIIWGIGLYKNIKRMLRFDEQEFIHLFDLHRIYGATYDATMCFSRRILNIFRQIIDVNRQHQYVSNPLSYDKNNKNSVENNNENYNENLNNENLNTDKLQETHNTSDTTPNVIDDPAMPLSRITTPTFNSAPTQDYVRTTVIDPSEDSLVDTDIIEDTSKFKIE